jgi:hypothetical protein
LVLDRVDMAITYECVLGCILWIGGIKGRL